MSIHILVSSTWSSGRWKLRTASGSHGRQPWKLRMVVVEMKEGSSQNRTNSATVGGYFQNQSQGIELDVQREEGCAATKGVEVAMAAMEGGHGLSMKAPNCYVQGKTS